MSNDPENLLPTQAESSTANVQQVASTETRQLSGPAFRVAVLLGLGALVWQAWWHYSTDGMARLFHPDASATRLIDRMMDYAAVSESASAPERFLQWIQNYSSFRAPEDAIKICGETIEHLRSAGFASETQDDMRRLEAVLLGETGRTNEMAKVLAGLEASRNSNVVRLLRVAYFHEPVGLPSISSFAGDDRKQLSCVELLNSFAVAARSIEEEGDRPAQRFATFALSITTGRLARLTTLTLR